MPPTEHLSPSRQVESVSVGGHRVPTWLGWPILTNTNPEILKLILGINFEIVALMAHYRRGHYELKNESTTQKMRKSCWAAEATAELAT